MPDNSSRSIPTKLQNGMTPLYVISVLLSSSSSFFRLLRPGGGLAAPCEPGLGSLFLLPSFACLTSQLHRCNIAAQERHSASSSATGPRPPLDRHNGSGKTSMESKNLDPACMYMEGCLCESCRRTITPSQPKAGFEPACDSGFLPPRRCRTCRCRCCRAAPTKALNPKPRQVSGSQTGFQVSGFRVKAFFCFCITQVARSVLR